MANGSRWEPPKDLILACRAGWTCCGCSPATGRRPSRDSPAAGLARLAGLMQAGREPAAGPPARWLPVASPAGWASSLGSAPLGRRSLRGGRQGRDFQPAWLISQSRSRGGPTLLAAGGVGERNKRASSDHTSLENRSGGSSSITAAVGSPEPLPGLRRHRRRRRPGKGLLLSLPSTQRRPGGRAPLAPALVDAGLLPGLPCSLPCNTWLVHAIIPLHYRLANATPGRPPQRFSGPPTPRPPPPNPGRSSSPKAAFQ